MSPEVEQNQRPESHSLDRRACLPDLALLAAAAVALRLWGLHRVGIVHFDSGGYAMSGLALAEGNLPGGLYPLQHFLSPPLYFGLVGGLMSVLRHTGDWIPVLVSVTFGTGTVVLSYLLLRQWATRNAALAAATLLIMSDFHILYSRAGLTDVSFTFLLVLAVWLVHRALDGDRAWRSVLGAGLAVGLAWNTKYHGWLALPIGVAAVVPSATYSRDWIVDRSGRLAVTAAIAITLYAPWALYVLAQDGGYARLLSEHASYVQPGDFLTQALAQAKSQLYLDGWFSRAAPAVAALFAGSGLRTRSRTLLTFGLLAFGYLMSGPVLAALLVPLGVRRMWRARSAGRYVLVALVLAFTLLTPMYHPYPRLLLPWTCGIFLLAGPGILELGQSMDDWLHLDELIGSRQAIVLAITVLAFVAAIFLRGTGKGVNLYRPSDGFERASQIIAEETEPNTPLLVSGEPAVVYYLRAAGREALHLDSPRDAYQWYEAGARVAFVTGIYARRVGDFRRWQAEHPGSFVLHSSVPAQVNAVRLLDDFSPLEARVIRKRNSNVFGLDGYGLQIYLVTLPRLTSSARR